MQYTTTTNRSNQSSVTSSVVYVSSSYYLESRQFGGSYDRTYEKGSTLARTSVGNNITESSSYGFNDTQYTSIVDHVKNFNGTITYIADFLRSYSRYVSNSYVNDKQSQSRVDYTSQSAIDTEGRTTLFTNGAGSVTSTASTLISSSSSTIISNTASTGFSYGTFTLGGTASTSSPITNTVTSTTPVTITQYTSDASSGTVSSTATSSTFNTTTEVSSRLSVKTTSNTWTPDTSFDTANSVHTNWITVPVSIITATSTFKTTDGVGDIADYSNVTETIPTDSALYSEYHTFTQATRQLTDSSTATAYESAWTQSALGSTEEDTYVTLAPLGTSTYTYRVESGPNYTTSTNTTNYDVTTTSTRAIRSAFSGTPQTITYYQGVISSTRSLTRNLAGNTVYGVVGFPASTVTLDGALASETVLFTEPAGALGGSGIFGLGFLFTGVSTEITTTAGTIQRGTYIDASVTTTTNIASATASTARFGKFGEFGGQLYENGGRDAQHERDVAPSTDMLQGVGIGLTGVPNAFTDYVSVSRSSVQVGLHTPMQVVAGSSVAGSTTTYCNISSSLGTDLLTDYTVNSYSKDTSTTGGSNSATFAWDVVIASDYGTQMHAEPFIIGASAFAAHNPDTSGSAYYNLAGLHRRTEFDPQGNSSTTTIGLGSVQSNLAMNRLLVGRSVPYYQAR